MPFIAVDTANTADVDLYYEDRGSGQPVVLVHGYPLDAKSWTRQLPPLLAAGYRVITYDRRGFGRSDAPTSGYDYDTLAANLNTLIEVLDLEDTVLVGFSMGTGEVGRYLGTYGPDRVSKAVFIAGLPPFLVKTADNPDGVDGSVLIAALSSVVKDSCAFFQEFHAKVYNIDEDRPARDIVDTYARSASAYAAVAAVVTWFTDFRRDVARIAGYHIATMILHGTHDRILPIDATARPLHKLLPDARYIEIAGAPHGLLWTDTDRINDALLCFLNESSAGS